MIRTLVGLRRAAPGWVDRGGALRGARRKDRALGDEQARGAHGRDQGPHHQARIGRDPLALEDPAHDHAPDESERDIPPPSVASALQDEPGEHAGHDRHQHPHDDTHHGSPFIGLWPFAA
jgi:hypothetical protein